MTREECEKKYGPIVNGRWVDEAKHCTLVLVPPEIRKHAINTLTRQVFSKVYCNKDMARPLVRAFQNLIKAGLEKELKTFDGCYNVRDVRGHSGHLSAHSYALAIDLNAVDNPLGGPISFSAEFVECFTREGFTWGGNFHRVDGQHFSFAGF